MLLGRIRFYFRQIHYENKLNGVKRHSHIQIRKDGSFSLRSRLVFQTFSYCRNVFLKGQFYIVIEPRKFLILYEYNWQLSSIYILQK